MADKKIFVVVAEPKLHDARPSPVNWFPTELEANIWVENFGNKKLYWFDVFELESTPGL